MTDIADPDGHVLYAGDCAGKDFNPWQYPELHKK